MRLALFWAVAIWTMTWAAFAQTPEPEYAPPPAWVVPVEHVIGPKPNGAPGREWILVDAQSRLTKADEDHYVRHLMRINAPDALRSAGERRFTWDPDHERVVVHWLRIHRAGEIIDALGARKFLVIQREQNLERSMLDGRLTATFQMEDLREGDVIDWSYTRSGRDPMLAGNSDIVRGLDASFSGERQTMRVIWEDSVDLRWANHKVAPVISAGPPGFQQATLDLAGQEPFVAQPMAPPRFRRGPFVEATTFASWNELSALMHPLYVEAARIEPDSALEREIDTIARAHTSQSDRALAALRLAQDRVRYFALSLGEGNLRPESAEAVWKARFGDCKGKTALLLAMLGRLGIKAQGALVHTGAGDGLNERLPRVGAFDHILVRAEIDGKVYWLDGAGAPFTGKLADMRVPGFRWALPISKEGETLEPLIVAPLEKPSTAWLLTIDLSQEKNGLAPFEMRVDYVGPGGTSMRRSVESANEQDMKTRMKQQVFSDYPFLIINDVDFIKDGPPDTYGLVYRGDAEIQWRLNASTRRYEFRFIQPDASLPSWVQRRKPEETAPIAIGGHPSHTRFDVRFILPKARGAFEIAGLNPDFRNAAFIQTQSAQVDANEAVYRSTYQSTAHEFPFAEFADTLKWMREADYDGKTLRAPRGWRPRVEATPAR
jgi:hypothetical protein